MRRNRVSISGVNGLLEIVKPDNVIEKKAIK